MTFQELIEKSRMLEKLASTIQQEYSSLDIVFGKDREPIEEDVQELIDAYQDWYGECLVWLPDDLHESFIAEYKTRLNRPAIESFLAYATQYSLSYDEAEGRTNRFWKYPYASCFRSRLLTQRQILIAASKRPAKKEQINAPESNEFDEEIDVIRQIINRHKKSKQTLELQAADYGAHPPIHIINQIDTLKETISILDRKIEIVRLTRDTHNSVAQFRRVLYDADNSSFSPELVVALKNNARNFINALEHNQKYLKQEYDKL